MLIFTTSQIIDPATNSSTSSVTNTAEVVDNQFIKIKIFLPFGRRQSKKEYNAKPEHKSTTEDVIAIFTIVRSFIIFAVYRLGAKIIISTKKTKLLLKISPIIKDRYPIRRMPGEYFPEGSFQSPHASPYHDSCV